MSLLDDLLAGRTDAELMAMRDELMRRAQMIPHDIAAIDRALAARQAESVARRQVSASTPDARTRIKAVLANGHMAPKEIAGALQADGSPPISEATLYNNLSRMAKSGELNRVRGRYALPSQSGRINVAAFGLDPSEDGLPPAPEEHESQSGEQGTQLGAE